MGHSASAGATAHPDMPIVVVTNGVKFNDGLNLEQVPGLVFEHTPTIMDVARKLYETLGLKTFTLYQNTGRPLSRPGVSDLVDGVKGVILTGMDDETLRTLWGRAHPDTAFPAEYFVAGYDAASSYASDAAARDLFVLTHMDRDEYRRRNQEVLVAVAKAQDQMRARSKAVVESLTSGKTAKASKAAPKGTATAASRGKLKPLRTAPQHIYSVFSPPRSLSS